MLIYHFVIDKQSVLVVWLGCSLEDEWRSIYRMGPKGECVVSIGKN